MSFAKDYEKRKKELDYNGCSNCKYQPEPLRMCEWGEKDTHIHLLCPRWEKRNVVDERYKNSKYISISV